MTVSTGPVAVVLGTATAMLSDVLDARCCWFEPFPFDAQLPRIEAGRIVLPPDEPAVARWQLDKGVELPVRFCGLPLGRFVLIPRRATVGVGFAPEARAAARRIADDFAEAYAPIAW